MIILLACLLTIGLHVVILRVRAKDLPEAAPVSPFQYLDERKAAIHENLRDLQFEYRAGKLSDRDYLQSKQNLQKALACLLEEVKAVPQPLVCLNCKEELSVSQKFCGACGKPVRAVHA